MEDFPGSLPESKPDDKDSKKRKKSAPVPLSGFAKVENGATAKPEKPPLNPALAELLLTGKETKAKTASTSEKPKRFNEPASERVESAAPAQPVEQAPGIAAAEKIQADTVEDDEDGEQQQQAPDQTVEKLEDYPSYESAPETLYSGEMIDLSGDRPVAERIIPLHDDAAEADAAVAARAFEQFEARYPITTPQPEQQAQALAPEALEPAPDTLVGGGGELPPADPPERIPTPSADPPERPTVPAEVLTPHPEDIYSTPEGHSVPPHTAAGEVLVSKREADDAAYYAERAGQNRGLLTGLLVGGAYEHFKHKRREKKAERRFEKQSKQLNEARGDYNYGLQEQARQQREHERQLQGAERRFAKEKQLENPARSEKLTPPKTAEQLALNNPEQLVVPADHRLETSAWHTIEVDAKTGKAVETPTFAYGHEYFRERAHENTPIDKRNAATGEVALVAAAGGLGQGTQADGSTAPSGPPLATTQGAPKAPKDKAKAAMKSVSDATAQAGPLWPWVIALVVIIICLAALLH